LYILYQWLENDFLTFFKQWEDSVTAFHKEKFEREKQKVLEKRKEKGRSDKECGQDLDDEDQSCLEGDRQVDHMDEQEASIVNEGRKGKDKEKSTTEKEEIKKLRERMRKDIEKCQISKETRCGIRFTGNCVCVHA
jgi:hypothetical protein